MAIFASKWPLFVTASVWETAVGTWRAVTRPAITKMTQRSELKTTTISKIQRTLDAKGIFKTR